MFDPNEFLNSTVTDSNDTTLINPPDNMSGDGYQILATKVDCRTWQAKADPSKSGLALDIQWSIEDESVKTFCGREKVVCKQGIMLGLQAHHSTGINQYHPGDAVGVGFFI
jgi:hypothetical protein